MMATGFLLVGPVNFMPFQTSISVIQGSMAIIGLGYGLIVVSTFGRSHRAAIRNGYSNDMDTYLIISGNVSAVTVAIRVAVAQVVHGRSSTML